MIPKKRRPGKTRTPIPDRSSGFRLSLPLLQAIIWLPNEEGPMVSIDSLISWLAEHGYRDQYPRRDAVNPDALFYVFVKDNRRRLGIRSVNGKVKKLHVEKLKQIVLQDEQDNA